MKNKPYAVFQTQNGPVTMTKDCLARWLCLMEGFYIMEKKAQDIGINLEKKDWIKPLAFEKYVQERFESMMLDMEIDAREGVFNDIKPAAPNVIKVENETAKNDLVVTTVS
jgi:hypothetical protein